MKKIIIAIGTSYVILMAGVVGYKLINDSSCYFNYKKAVTKAEGQIKTAGDSKSSEETVSNKDSKPAPNEVQPVPVNNNPAANSNVNPAPVQENKYANIKFTRALSEGSTGDDVRKLQEILKNKQYYNGEISGAFNGDTKKALMSYQKDKKLWADGILGPGTWKTFEQ